MEKKNQRNLLSYILLNYKTVRDPGGIVLKMKVLPYLY